MSLKGKVAIVTGGNSGIGRRRSRAGDRQSDSRLGSCGGLHPSRFGGLGSHAGSGLHPFISSRRILGMTGGQGGLYRRIALGGRIGPA